MSRRRLKTGEDAKSFAVSLSESELEEMDADAARFDPNASGKGNRSAFLRRIYRAWKKRILYADSDKEDEQMKALKAVEEDTEALARMVKEMDKSA